MRVFVYFNLHRKCLSVKALEGERKGRVIMHADSVELVDAQFKVSIAGRERVLREKRKNVHAGVVGSITDINLTRQVLTRAGAMYTPVKYNPYRFQTFVTAVNEVPIATATRAVVASVNGRGVIFADGYR